MKTRKPEQPVKRGHGEIRGYERPEAGKDMRGGGQPGHRTPNDVQRFLLRDFSQQVLPVADRAGNEEQEMSQ